MWRKASSHAFRLKLALQEFYEQPDQRHAEDHVGRWYQWAAVRSRLEPMKRLTYTIRDIEVVGDVVRRKRIPQGIVTDVLIRCRRRCCLCYGLTRDLGIKLGQIADLDHDPGNNDVDNLVFLCLEHHNLYDTRFRQSKGITEDEVRHFWNELLTLIDYAWKHPVAIDGMDVHPVGDISGCYIREGEVDNAELQIDVVAPNRIRVSGLALWGVDREYGPNIGELDFEVSITDGTIV